MNYYLLATIIIVIILFIFFFKDTYTQLSAIAVFDQPNSPQGIVLLDETNEGLKIRVKLTNVPDGLHGFHVHTYGDLSDGCKSAGGHFDIYGNDHGDLVGKSHSGDLGNLVAKNGKVNQTMVTRKLSLHGMASIVGRSLVLHADKDDLGKGDNEESKKTGNSGSRMACAVIGLRKKSD